MPRAPLAVPVREPDRKGRRLRIGQVFGDPHEEFGLLFVREPFEIFGDQLAWQAISPGEPVLQVEFLAARGAKGSRGGRRGVELRATDGAVRHGARLSRKCLVRLVSPFDRVARKRPFQAGKIGRPLAREF